MDTHHHHNHHHHHHHEISASMSKIFIFCIALNLLFVGIETVVGLLYNSVGLLSDAGHNLSDVFSLVLVLVAFRMSLHQPHSLRTGIRKPLYLFL